LKSKNIVFTLLVIVIINVNTVAQNYNDALLLSEPGILTSARALAMGNSYTALSNDYSGVLFNPAGLGLIKKTDLSLSMNYNSFDNQTTFFNKTLDASQTAVNFNQIGFVYPLPTVKGSLVFAMGYNRTKEFNSIMEFDGFNGNNNSMIQFVTGDVNDEVPITNDIGLAYEIRDSQLNSYIKDTTLINGMLNQSGTIKKQGNLGNWSFASSLEIAKGLFIGGTFNILTGNYKSDRDYWEDDTQNIYGNNIELVPNDPTTQDFQTFYMNDIIEWDLSGWDSKLGLLYNFEDFFRFGGAVKFPSFWNVKETFYVDATSQFGTGSVYQLDPKLVDNIEYEIKTPFEYSAGVALHLLILTVSGDAKIIDYREMEFTQGFSDEYRIERNKEIEDLFRAALTLNVGAELKVPALPIYGRIGAMYVQSPYADDPAEFDKKYLTAGGGIIFADAFSIDVAFVHGWWEDYGDNYGFNQSRTYQDINIQNVILGISAKL
jgi:hypothetical protein